MNNMFDESDRNEEVFGMSIDKFCYYLALQRAYSNIFRF